MENHSREAYRVTDGAVKPDRLLEPPIDYIARLRAQARAAHGRAASCLAAIRQASRQIKAARFPAVKSLDSFDFLALPSLNKMLVLELARSDYVLRRENIIAIGNSEPAS
jgi:hypothetical protein